ASFFTSQQYDALVPGKHDFYYGPERLRQLATLLAKSGTQMLAANLILKSKLANPPVELDKHLLAQERNYESSAGSMKWALRKTLLQWIRNFRLKSFREDLIDPSKAGKLCVTTDRDVNPAICEDLSPADVKGSDAEYRILRKDEVGSERTYLVC